MYCYSFEWIKKIFVFSHWMLITIIRIYHNFRYDVNSNTGALMHWITKVMWLIDCKLKMINHQGLVTEIFTATEGYEHAWDSFMVPAHHCRFMFHYSRLCSTSTHGPWCLTIVVGQLGIFFIEIMCCAPRISRVRSTGLLSIFLRAQPCYFKKPWCIF